MKTATYILSYERPEILRCCLAAVCGWNSGVGPIYIIDDSSQDPRVAGLIDAYVGAGLIQTDYRTVKRSGVGWTRRMMVNEFLASDAKQLVQVEGDMLISPASIARLVAIYDDLREAGFRAGWLCTHNHGWCHKIAERREVAGYELGLVGSGSEPFWTVRRDVLEAHHRHITPIRGDLVEFIKAAAQSHSAAVILEPEIQAQHLGAIDSIYYPQFSHTMVTYQNHDGSARQPFPWFEINFARMQAGYPDCYTRLARILEARSPVPLPCGEV